MLSIFMILFTIAIGLSTYGYMKKSIELKEMEESEEETKYFKL